MVDKKKAQEIYERILAASQKDASERIYKDKQRCPFCRSTSMEYEGVDVDGCAAHQGVSCCECGAEWTEHYRFDGISVQGLPDVFDGEKREGRL